MRCGIFLLTIFFASLSYAQYGNFEGCGKYTVAGIPRLVDKKFQIIVHEKSIDEFKINLTEFDAHYIKLKEGLTISAELDIYSRDGTKLFGRNISNINLILPHPLNPMESAGFNLIKKENCLPMLLQ